VVAALIQQGREKPTPVGCPSGATFQYFTKTVKKSIVLACGLLGLGGLQGNKSDAPEGT
jgi:hypothetical protein